MPCVARALLPRRADAEEGAFRTARKAQDMHLLLETPGPAVKASAQTTGRDRCFLGLCEQ